jgi:hypothetical protein
MKKLLAVFLLLTITIISFSQQPAGKSRSKKPVANPALSKADLQKMKLIEDSLHLLCVQFTTDTVIETRIKACYAFIPKLVSALKLNNSFYHHFDSLETVSQIYPRDSSFRILTWQLVLPKGQFRYYGVLQMKSGKLKMFPLRDYSDTMQYQTQQQTTNDNWYGALYYNVIEQQVNKQPVYTLFGFEAADYITRRKVVEILTFDKTGKPHFGAPLFHFKYDSTHVKLLDTMSRFFIEYKYSAPTVLNYDAQLQMIVFDHVAPPNEKANGATFSYVPDGTYEGFLWTKDHWQWVEKVFTFSIGENDNPPIPQPLFGQPGRQPELPKEVSPR